MNLRMAERQPQLVFELAAARFDDDQSPGAFEDSEKPVDGEGPERDRAKEAHLDAFVPQVLYGALGELRRSVACNDDDLGILATEQVITLLGGGHGRVLVVQGHVVLLKLQLGKTDRADQVAPVGAVAEHGPLGDAWDHHLCGQPYLACHLAEVAVTDDHDRVAILEGELERDHGDVEHLLGRCGGKHDGMCVAVAEAAADELDVGLLGSDVAKARASPHDVHEDSRHLGADHVGDALEHQAEARGAGEGHTALACSPGPVHHVDRRNLARPPARRRRRARAAPWP